MKRLFIGLILGAAVFAAAAEELPGLRKNAVIAVVVNSVAQANGEVDRIIEKYGLVIGNANINNSRGLSEYELFAADGNLEEILSDIGKLGIISLKEITARNFTTALDEAGFELEYLNSQRQIYAEELQKRSNSREGETVSGDLFARAREIDRIIYEKNREIQDLQRQMRYTVIRVTLSEKSIQDLDGGDDFSGFINMPGVEAKYFHAENSEGTSLRPDYIGGTLRYMFTKGRSYFLIGVMKPVEASGEAAAVNDIVSYALGKDFYPRYFGQGKNRFLNPFSGFEIGGMILTSDTSFEHMFVVEPHIGLEFFKNKYVIFDTRIGYTFPLDEAYIKSRRGFTAYLSLNIVF